MTHLPSQIPMLSGKTGRNDPCPCGSGKKYKQCCLIKQATPAQPQALDQATAQLLMDGFALYRGARWDEAAAICMKVLKVRAEQPDALHLLGLVEQGRGHLQEALALIDRALALGPNMSMQSNRGIVLQAMGRSAEAAASFRTALVEQPDSVVLLCNLAACLEALQRWDEVSAVYRRVLELDSRNVSALSGMGVWLQMQRDSAGAQAHLRRALEIRPGHAVSLSRLGNVLWAGGELDGALALYEEAVRIAPAEIAGWHNLGEALLSQSRPAEAQKCFDRAYALQPNLEWRIRRDLLLPHIYESRQQMTQWRAAFETHLDQLISDSPAISEPTVLHYCTSIWKLAFHGENDLTLMRKLARFYVRACPDLEYRAAHIDSPLDGDRKMRIGFFSNYMHAKHSVPRCFASLICLLADDPRFEVCLISPNAVDAEHAGLYANFKGRFVTVGKDYSQARRAIEAEALDVLVYQDIGMEALSYFLAFARLARTQCVLGGHPVTTGIPNLDCYISTALAEAPDAASHYSEELLLLPSLPVVYEHPHVPSPAKSRIDLGLPLQGALYVCPMMLQKIHPDFDTAIERLLRRDPEGHVILFRHDNARWEEQLQLRFERSIAADVRQRIFFMPWLHNYDDFVSVNKLADVVIDPFHFGIGSTVIATFAVGTPLVTWPSRYLRGRAGLAYCTLMEVADACVADGLEDYVERAFQIAHDSELRARLQQSILANKARLFDNEESVHDIAQLFRNLLKRHGSDAGSGASRLDARTES